MELCDEFHSLAALCPGKEPTEKRLVGLRAGLGVLQKGKNCCVCRPVPGHCIDFTIPTPLI